MRYPRCIRIFRTSEDAEYAKAILASINIESFIKEDGFGELKLKDLGMQSRFRFYIQQEDIDKAGAFLAKKLKEKKLKK